MKEKDKQKVIELINGCDDFVLILKRQDEKGIYVRTCTSLENTLACLGLIQLGLNQTINNNRLKN